MPISSCIQHPAGSQSISIPDGLPQQVGRPNAIIGACIAKGARRPAEIPAWLGLGRSSIIRSVKILVRAGLVSETTLDPESIKNILCSKTPQSVFLLGNVAIGYFREECSWCGCFTTTIHDHHFPILQSKGGTETVRICSNCHFEYHALFGRILTPTKVLLALYPEGRYPLED